MTRPSGSGEPYRKPCPICEEAYRTRQAQDAHDTACQLVVDLIMTEQLFPGGYQIALGMRIDKAINAVDELFSKHDLPKREQILAELGAWRRHTDEGVKLWERSEKSLHTVTQLVRDRAERAPKALLAGVPPLGPRRR